MSIESSATPARRSPPGRGVRPYVAFAISVYYGGFFAWLLMFATIWIVAFADSGPASELPVLVVFSIIVWLAYCTIIVLVFFFIPFLVVTLGRRYPARSWPITLLTSMSSSVAIWLVFAWLMEMPLQGPDVVLTIASIVASLVGGAVAGHSFWKRIFPPLAAQSEIFR